MTSRSIRRAMLFLAAAISAPSAGAAQTIQGVLVLQVIASDDKSFTDAVSSTVSRSRYLPAERDGHKVAQVFDIAVDFGFANDPPRATGDNLIVVRAFGVTRRVTGTP